MSIFRLILNEKRDKFCFKVTYEKFIKAKNRDEAYGKSLKIASTFGEPDRDMIFWSNGNNSTIWINSLEEIEIV